MKVEFLDEIGRPANNKILVALDLNAFYSKVSSAGIVMPNAAHRDAEADSPGYSLSEFMGRAGEIVGVPACLSRGLWDWHSPVEFRAGDIAYWNITVFFDMEKFELPDKKVYALIDYHEIHAIERDGVLLPVNGYYLFTEVMEEKKALGYVKEVPSGYFRLEAKDDNILYEKGDSNTDVGWEVGSRCLLSVPPMRLSSFLSQDPNKKYYAAQRRHILMAFAPCKTAAQEIDEAGATQNINVCKTWELNKKRIDNGTIIG